MVAILGANSVSGEYEVSNSLRFDDGDSPNLQRTFSSGNQTDWTWSAWVKRGNISNNNQVIFGRQNVADGSNIGKILFTSSDELKLNNKVGASTGFEAVTFAKFRDPSAWYHIWISFDGNQSTHNDRATLYVNGVQFSWNSSSSLSAGNGHINLNLPHAVGFRAGDGGEQYDGYIAEMHFIDGNNSLNHTDFGEFDNNGVWIPKQYTGSYGTNGFFLEFKQTGTSQNSSGIGADTSGNDNHFAVTNLAATDITEDTCTNNFATLNPNDNTGTLSEGNLKDAISTSNARSVTSTIGVSSGKWYCEVVPTAMSGGGSGNNLLLGVVDDTFSAKNSSSTYPFNHTTSVGYFAENGQKKINGSFTSYGATFAVNDIIGVAFNLDDDEITFYKNGTTQGTISHTFPSSQYRFYLSHGSSAGSTTAIINFGQEGSFAGTKTAQGNSDGKYGNFYYAPPSGYYALCTKRLAEFG
jgi:hypothetical protein